MHGRTFKGPGSLAFPSKEGKRSDFSLAFGKLKLDDRNCNTFNFLFLGISNLGQLRHFTSEDRLCYLTDFISD